MNKGKKPDRVSDPTGPITAPECPIQRSGANSDTTKRRRRKPEPNRSTPFSQSLTVSKASLRQATPQSTTQEQTAPKRKAFESGLTLDQRDRITELLSQPNPLNDTEIARQIGCTYKAVKNLKLRIADVSDRVQTIYQRRFIKELPPSERVKLYGQLARGNIDAKRAFSSLKALQRVEELEGIVTKKEQKEADSHSAPLVNGPVFVIQGASIQVGSTPQVVVEARLKDVPILAGSDEPVESTS